MVLLDPLWLLHVFRTVLSASTTYVQLAHPRAASRERQLTNAIRTTVQNIVQRSMASFARRISGTCGSRTAMLPNCR
jgi:hypothetical protein